MLNGALTCSQLINTHEKRVCHSEPRLTFSLKDQAYFLTLHTVFYQHALSEGDDNYKKPPIQLIFHVNRHHPYNRLIDKTLVYL